ncbi:hypothetical protein H8E88_23250 [candidate division KSB1 bacterium]|nr:hypothetical protein [candidate division KSB1 bacterium]MBL7092938.1 hypothetical protein [candidate division KSB1 bacterium]
MSFDNNISQNEQFYEELIKRFFHRESYFYYCLRNSLSGEPGKKQFDKSTSAVVSKLIEFLINSNDPITEFKEISNAEKFNNFYESIKSQLSKINLPDLDNNQTKNIIQDLALKTLEDFIRVFSKKNNRFVLQSYLNLKLKLKSLLDDSNGNETNLGKYFINEVESNSYLLEGEKAELIDQTSILAEVFITGQQEEVVAFQKFFEEEIRFTLRPIAEADTEQTSHPDFIKKCYDVFNVLIELGKFHNNYELVIISEKVLQLIKAVKKMVQSEIQPAIELILAANRAIEHFVFSHHTPQELNKFLKKHDDFLLQLGINEKGKNQLENEILEQVFKDTIEKNKEEKLTDEDESSTRTLENSKLNEEKKEVNFSEKKLKKDILQSEIPGDENEGLMDLIQEIDSSIKANSTEQTKKVPIGKNGLVKIETEDNAPNPDPLDTFSREAHLFFQVILNAIANVDEKNDDSTYLEDIELASSSLKILTKKCELNKILILPELIESICINMKAMGKHLPNTMLEKIKEGILLLKIFDQKNAEHESKLLAILFSLKKYYSFTVKALEKNSIV